MLAVVPILLAFVVLFLGIFMVFLIYLWLLWYATNSNMSSTDNQDDEKSSKMKGLSELELKSLPVAKAMEEIKAGTDCVICLDEIEVDQLIRLLPICNHGFHLECADFWLSKNSVCPICRTKIQLHTVVEVDHGD
ncbi:hypothetical protein MKW94_029700 [Papaver nudicaule]|uniref:RING-type domain-containing protein n=1 Tax=Papaver nudicaule TaxID=74823 RepID=A0AA42AXW0_PAPNU|nr:hypothetical protein [Papaver nudicaule]